MLTFCISSQDKLSFYTLEWIDKETMTAAITKAQAITDMIGYPAYIMEEGGHALNKKYYNLTVKADQYYNNTINRNLFGFTVSFKHIAYEEIIIYQFIFRILHIHLIKLFLH